MIFIARPEKWEQGHLIPAEPLDQHLSAVAQKARQSLSLPTLPNTDNLSNYAELCGLTHDFGKYTSFFQNKLPPKRLEPPKQEYGSHAFISALLASFVATQRYPDEPEVALMVYLAIHRHHGHLVSPSDILPMSCDLKGAPSFNIDGLNLRMKNRHLYAVAAQLTDIRSSRHCNQIISEMTEIGIPEVQEFLNLSPWWNILGQLSDKYTDIENIDQITFYWQLNLLFSALIDADKHVSAAAGQGKDLETLPRFDLPSQLIDNHISELPRSNAASDMEAVLQSVRTSIYAESTQEVLNKRLQELYPAVLSLTAPTGSGKTLTALGCAFRLRERIMTQHGFYARIIYALPFVNIINQNYDVIEKVLAQLPDFALHKSSYLLKHHHLAPLAFSENEDRSNDDALLLTESWESEVIVTTFVQLLETLITNKNRSLKKLHNIMGSIIILDEVQSIPYEQWRLLEYVLSTLTKYLGCTILQMTATKPQIFRNSPALELLRTPKAYFQGLSRTRLVPRQDITSLEDLQAFIKQEKQPDRSMLVVVNTINTSIALYERLRQDFEGFHEFKESCEHVRECLVYLSTNITPWQRQQRVTWLKNFMSKGGKPLVVSTQVIEAGVDLDFDFVIRDLGPLDSIVQVAGRCNRNGKKGSTKNVYIVSLERDSGKLDAQLVYDRIMPQISREILTDSIDETELFEKIEDYFNGCNRLSDNKSYKFIKAINKLHYHFSDGSLSVSDYAFIESFEQIPITIELNEEAKKCVVRLEQLYQYGGDKHQFREVYRNLSVFTISPSIHKVKTKEKEQIIPKRTLGKESSQLFVPYADVWADYPHYYKLETGFIWEQITPFF